jgi:UPF0716 protein FxsA
MTRWLFLAGILVGILDLYLLYLIGAAWGVLAVLAVIFLPAFFGVKLAFRQGLRCFARMQEELAAGRMPSQQIAEAPVILLAGLLMIYPGPVTTCLGLLLLIPGLRRAVARLSLRRARSYIATSVAPGGPGAGEQGGGGVFVQVVRIGDAAPGGPGSLVKDAEGRDLGPKPDDADEKKKELPPPA